MHLSNKIHLSSAYINSPTIASTFDLTMFNADVDSQRCATIGVNQIRAVTCIPACNARRQVFQLPLRPPCVINHLAAWRSLDERDVDRCRKKHGKIKTGSATAMCCSPMCCSPL